MNRLPLPKYVSRLNADQRFSFSCHQGIPCFTRCCHELELALSPYDVLRLRQATGLHSSALLERYVIMEQDDGDLFPRFYLTMVDDGTARCVFVTGNGCSVYHHRPGACRTYPLGRATIKGGAGLEQHLILLREPHCRGFFEDKEQTAERFMTEQGLGSYNRFNDLLADLQQHPEIRAQKRLTEAQRNAYITALYDIDTFRSSLGSGTLKDTPEFNDAIYDDDEALLTYAIKWLEGYIFNRPDSCR